MDIATVALSRSMNKSTNLAKDVRLTMSNQYDIQDYKLYSFLTANDQAAKCLKMETIVG